MIIDIVYSEFRSSSFYFLRYVRDKWVTNKWSPYGQFSHDTDKLFFEFFVEIASIENVKVESANFGIPNHFQLSLTDSQYTFLQLKYSDYANYRSVG